MAKIVVYTVIMGDYEALRPTKYNGVCLTDSDIPPTGGWEIRTIKGEHSDPRRAARYPKMMPHVYFPKAKYTIYLDGNVGLLNTPALVVRDLLRKEDMALFPHPERGCTYEEAVKCITYKKADPKVVEQQMEYYRRVKFPADYGLTACWVIIRRNTSKVRQFGEAWWDEYLQFTQRDQLCFDYVRWQLGMKYNRIPGNLFKSTSAFFQRGKHIKRE